MPRQFYGSWHTSTPWRERFWAKVRKEPGRNGCWIWTCAVKKGRREYDSRPVFKDKGKWWRAARFIWTKLRGAIPEGMQVLHTCDNSMCVRPKHLWLGTQLDNIEDMRLKGRSRGPDRRGEGVPNSKLTEKEARQLLRLRGDGWLLRELERKFEISQAQISRIINGHRWAHLQ